MSLFQKIKKYLPIRSESFYKRSREIEQQLQSFQTESAELHQKQLDVLRSQQQELQNTISKLNTLLTDFRLFHAQASCRRAYFIKKTIPLLFIE